MPSYTVPINGPNGPGFMTVNANNAAEATVNAQQGGNYATGGAVEGGHRASSAGGTAVSTGAAPSGVQPTTSTGTGNAANDLDNLTMKIWQAIADGNAAQLQETIREFNATFGLNEKEFAEKVRQFNEGLYVTQANLTGQYQGQPTLPAMTSYANQFGQWGVPTVGQQTLAAQQQAYAQQLGAIQTAATLQANPFRQAEVIGQLGPLLSGRGVAGFQAPGQATGQTDFSGLGNMQRLIDDIRGGPNAVNSQSTQSVLNAIPTPNKVNSVEFLRSSPLTQNLLLSGMSQKYGIDPQDALNQIKNTLPAFTAPSTFGQVRG